MKYGDSVYNDLRRGDGFAGIFGPTMAPQIGYKAMRRPEWTYASRYAGYSGVFSAVEAPPTSPWQPRKPGVPMKLAVAGLLLLALAVGRK